jgi:hypothetical protein
MQHFRFVKSFEAITAITKLTLLLQEGGVIGPPRSERPVAQNVMKLKKVRKISYFIPSTLSQF